LTGKFTLAAEIVAQPVTPTFQSRSFSRDLTAYNRIPAIEELLLELPATR